MSLAARWRDAGAIPFPPFSSAFMGRRSLRKIDPTIDLSRHLRGVEELPRPWDRGVLFGRAAPLEVEIGSGKGLFLRTAAAARPEVDFLGVEIARRYAEFTAAALAKQNLPNAVVVYGDALRLFRELLPEASLAAVHVYFPDPWWKKRHKKRRVMQEPLLRRHRTDASARRHAALLDRRGRVFSYHGGIVGRMYIIAGAVGSGGDPGRARHGVSDAFRASHAAAQRGGLSGGVPQGGVGEKPLPIGRFCRRIGRNRPAGWKPPSEPRIPAIDYFPPHVATQQRLTDIRLAFAMRPTLLGPENALQAGMRTTLFGGSPSP